MAPVSTPAAKACRKFSVSSAGDITIPQKRLPIQRVNARVTGRLEHQQFGDLLGILAIARQQF